MTFDYIVEGNIFVNGVFQQCCIGVEDEKIKSVKKILTGAEKKQFRKQVILPAGIDVHVHFRDPGFPQKETFQSGSIAAAFGGISCVFDMPNTRPHSTTKATIISKIKNAEKLSVIDFGIYGAICDENLEKIDEVIPLVPGFKAYLGSSTNSLLFSKENLVTLFHQYQYLKKPVLFHAEDDDCLKRYKIKEHQLLDHHRGRPCICERTAVQSLLSHAPFPFPVHICHVSSPDTLSLLLSQKSDVSFGITPHHSLLHFDIKQKQPQSHFKVNPPLRSSEQQQQLLYAFVQNQVPIIESDHAPHTLKEKSLAFADAPSGISGVETMYPLFLFLAYQQSVPFTTVIRSLCEQPGKLLGISKGYIKEGFDADFIVVDLKQKQMISQEFLHSKANFSPFEGYPAIFPNHVFVRGMQIIQDSSFIAKPGTGRHITEDKLDVKN